MKTFYQIYFIFFVFYSINESIISSSASFGLFLTLFSKKYLATKTPIKPPLGQNIILFLNL